MQQPEYGSFDQLAHRDTASSSRRLRVVVPMGLAVLAVAVVVFVAGDLGSGATELLVASPEQAAMQSSLQAQQIKDAQEDQTRAKEIASLLLASNADLQKDESIANTLAQRAQRQSVAVAQLRQKMTQSLQLANSDAHPVDSEEIDAAEQNQLLQQEAALKEQEQQLLLGESEESNLAAEAEQQAHQSGVGETKDEGLIASENAAVQGDKNAVIALFAKERPLMNEVQQLQNQVNAARVTMQNAMNKVDQYKENAQAKVIEAQMAARSKQRNDRDNAEEALNHAVAREQRLQNGPDHKRLKLKGAAAQQLTLAQQAVKKAQAALAAAYSDNYTPPQVAPSAPSAAHIAAENAENAATAKVESLMSKLSADKRKLGLLESRVENYQNRQMQNDRLLQMIDNRAQQEEGSIAVITGRAAAARAQAEQNGKQVAALEKMAQAVAKKIQFYQNKRKTDLTQLSTQQMAQKKVAAKAQAAQTDVSSASQALSQLQALASKAYSKVAAEAKQIGALKAEQREDLSQAAQLLAEAHASDAPEPLPPAPFPTNNPPAMTAN